MKKILIFLLLIASLTANATVWHIATTGNDGTGDGSEGTPWLTLAYAISQASSGDSIYVTAGTYNVSAQIELPVGISIYGAGNTSIIKSTYAWSTSWPSTLIATLRLRSTSEGTEGNQSISYLKFDGDALTATAAICVSARSNVSIHHCEFVDFLNYGVSFTGTVDMGYGEATTYASGNSFYDNVMTNCVTDGAGTSGRGSLMIGSDEGMLIYNNTFTGVDRGGSDITYGIQKMCLGFHKGLKIYDNTSNMGIELWYCRGGVEFYRNRIDYALDFGGIDATWGNVDINDAGGYGYGAKVYDNVIGNPVYPTTWRSAINLEQTIRGGVYIYRNVTFKRPVPVMFSPGSDNCVVRDVYIFSNVFYDIGRSGSPLAYGIWLKTSADYVTVGNINILNNHIISGTSPAMYAGICFGKVSGDTINIKNNIIQGAADYAISFDAGDTLDLVVMQNNLFYDNAHSDAVNTAATSVLTNKTEDNLTPANPVFVSTTDLHLQSTSPCIDAGVDVSAVTGGTDFHGASLYGAAYDIGAFEYGVNRMLKIDDTTLPTINYKVILIDH